MSMTRYDPFRSWSPLVDVYEDSEGVNVSAESREGVLRIFLPKKAETKPSQIKVQLTPTATSAGPRSRDTFTSGARRPSWK
jgi:HSP20 family molecular chaperone IbpA